MKKGLTLVELMIVISLIGFMAIIAASYLRQQVHKGNDARRKADINKISLAVEEYEKDNDCYPQPSEMVCNPGIGLNPYLDKIPCDPANRISYYYEHDGDSSCPRWYRIYAKLDNAEDSDYQAEIGPSGIYSYYASSPNAPALSSETTGLSGLFGCKSGVCVPITWDPSRPGAACDSNYGQSDCQGTCGTPFSPLNECVPWH